MSVTLSERLLVAFVAFVLVMFFTPGPNNIMLMSSGLTHGFRRTLPHMAGVTLGFGFMIASVRVGLGAVFLAYPILERVLRYAGAAYLVYLAFVIATSAPATAQSGARRGPMSFWGAAMFQWVNGKGWVVIIGTITAYAAIARYPWNIVIQTAVSLAAGAASTMAWALFGSTLRSVRGSGRSARIFNIAMAVLLLASLYPVLTER